MKHEQGDKLEISEGQAAARGTLVTLFFRIVSFACTQATFRFLDAATLGKASIRLELILTTVLFISREGFRLSLTRQISQDNWFVAWLTIPTVFLLSISALMWHLFVSELARDDKDYRIGGILYCVAALIEGCGEPAVLYFLRRMDLGKRSSAEGVATIAKTLATMLLLRYIDPVWYVTVFGAAQIIYALVYSSYLYYNSWGELALRNASSVIDWPTCYLTLLFTGQGFFKHLLTEADRIVLTYVGDSYDQGVYAMGSAYGGMAARILLQPLEENSRLLWSRLAGSKQISRLKDSYAALVKLVLYIGLLFTCVAVNYTNLLLSILAGRKWGGNAEAANVLSAFCVYTAFLAFNGMTEAFVYGVTTSGGEIGRLGIVHTVTGGVFAVSSFFLVPQYGSVGLVSANCIAMLFRSIYSIHYASSYFLKRQEDSVRGDSTNILRDLLPHPLVLLGFTLAFFATRWSLDELQQRNLHQSLDLQNKEWLYFTGRHVATGILSVLGIATFVFTIEKTFLRSIQSMVDSKNREKTD